MFAGVCVCTVRLYKLSSIEDSIKFWIIALRQCYYLQFYKPAIDKCSTNYQPNFSIITRFRPGFCVSEETNLISVKWKKSVYLNEGNLLTLQIKTQPIFRTDLITLFRLNGPIRLKFCYNFGAVGLYATVIRFVMRLSKLYVITLFRRIIVKRFSMDRQ